MNYTLNELLDIPTLQNLLDSLDEINSTPSAVLDTKGNILTATAWQNICTKFHRKHQETARKCIKSDTCLEVNIGEPVSPVVYRCPMGLIDSAIPIIVEGEHLGNVFIGQLFTEPPDEAYFIGQAREYGFDENTYLEAVHNVPICSDEQLRKNLVFIGNLVQILAEQGLQGRRQLESERELRERKKKLRVIFDTSEAGIIVVSPLGIITFANRRMADMFATTLTELVGSHYIDYLHESEILAGAECMKQIITGEKKSIELVRHYIRKDGSDFWGNLTGTRLEDIDGSMRDQIIVISDITERKRAEEEKRAFEQQLQQAQKLESLGVLAGGIAHDFNNILTVILGGCYMLRQDRESPPEIIATIENAAERAAGLCRQMMTYAGKAPFELSQVNLATIVHSMVEMLKTTIHQNVVIKYDHPAEAVFIKGDVSQLSQITMNLIINAAEAIAEAHGEIIISLTTPIIEGGQSVRDHQGKEIPPGVYACLEVTDNGCGMDEETMKRIFEPFYTTKFIGRGLGMSAVLGIISAHTGTLQLFSQPGQGTTFKVYLPLQVSTMAGEKSQTQNSAPMPWRGSGTILLVEDDKEISGAVKVMLEGLGFKVIEAVDGKEALELYHKHAADIALVMTDIGMPVMDGYDLFRELKNCNAALPIIVSSGFGSTVVTSRIPREELAGLIDKPYNFIKLRNVLKSVMEGIENRT